MARVTGEDGRIEGGPIVGRADKHEPDSLVERELVVVICGSTSGPKGSPPRQVGAAGRRRARPAEMVLLPPFILKAVASSLWPSALFKQVADVWLL